MMSIGKWNGIDAVFAKNEFAEAVVTLNGAHVVSYIPAGKKEVIWVSGKSIFADGTAIRGGIPVCWPWFGGARKPTHGFSRTSRWTLDFTEEKKTGTVLHFYFHPDVEEFSNLSAELQVTVGSSLTAELTTINNGSTPFALSDGLHTYFSIAEIEKTKVTGLEGTTYIDRLDSDTRKTQQGPVVCTAETDRIYISGEAVVIDDGERKIRMAKSGSKATVVWNPWIEKSKKMADFGDLEYHNMICVESVNAGDDIIQLEPGKKHTVSTEITLL